MRVFLRVILPVAVLVAFVGGMTYFLQFTPDAPEPKQPAAAADKSAEESTLFIPERIAVWDPDEPDYQQEYERGHPGLYDFWVANPSRSIVTVVHRFRSCKCTSVELGDLPPDAALEGVRMMAALNSLHALLPTMSFNLSGLPVGRMMSQLRWRELNVNDAPVVIEAADPRLGTRLEVVRIRWDSKEIGPRRLDASINYLGGDKKPAEIMFQVPIVVVPPVQILPPAIELGILRAGESRPMELYVWTSTRDHCPLAMPKIAENPCFVFGEPKRLDPNEDLRKYAEGQPKTRIREGFRVPFTLYEERGDSQLELGPLQKRIVFNPETEFEAAVQLNGTVRGDIKLAGKDGQDHIELGSFPSELPFHKKVLVTSQRGDMKLSVQSSPAGMKVALVSSSPGVWEIQIDIDAEAIQGSIPVGSAIVLQTGEGRKIRIPVTGSGLVS